jgi:hypothetical protein
MPQTAARFRKAFSKGLPPLARERVRKPRGGFPVRRRTGDPLRRSPFPLATPANFFSSVCVFQKPLRAPPSARFGVPSAQLRSLCSLQPVPREGTRSACTPATRREAGVQTRALR